MKFCKKCPEPKTLRPLSDFYKCKGMRDGYFNSCKQCMNRVTREWYDAHPEVVKAKYKKKGHKPRKRTRYTWFKKDKCRRCGFVPEDMCQLTVDHIDRNRKNSDESNLQTLCGNCHYLKSKVEMTQPEKLKICNLIP